MALFANPISEFFWKGVSPENQALAKKTAVAGLTMTPITAAWGKLGTTGKVLVGAGAGAGAYSVYDWLFGGKKAVAPQAAELKQDLKQDMPIVVNPVVTVPNVSSNYQYDYSTFTNIISNSPNSAISAKKGGMRLSSTFKPDTSVPFSLSPSQSASQKESASQAQGTDFATIAAIVGVAFVAATYFKGKEKHK